jgi:hypothetical protein
MSSIDAHLGNSSKIAASLFAGRSIAFERSYARQPTVSIDIQAAFGAITV